MEKHNQVAAEELEVLDKTYSGFSFWKFPSHIVGNRSSALTDDLIHFNRETLTAVGMVRVKANFWL